MDKNLNNDISNIVKKLFQKTSKGFYEATDWIVEHPKAASAAIWLSSQWLLTHEYITKSDYHELPNWVKPLYHSYYALATLLLFTLPAYLVFRILSVYNKPYLKNVAEHIPLFFKGKWYDIKGNEKKAIEQRVKARELLKPSHPIYAIEKGAGKIALGEGEEGFRNLIDGLINMVYRNYDKSGWDVLLTPYNFQFRYNANRVQRKIEKNIKKGRVDIPKIIDIIVLNSQLGRRKKSESLLEELAKSDYEAQKLLPTLGFLHHLHGEYKLANEFWSRGIEIQEESTTEKLISVPGSNVRYREGAYGEMYRIKFDERERLEDENRNIQKLNQILRDLTDENEFGTVIPITVTEILDEDCYITLTSPGNPLTEVIKNNLDMLSKTTDYQSLIHAKMTPGFVKDNLNHLKPLEKRLNESDLESNIKDKIYKNAPVTFKHFPANDILVFDRDGHPKQYLVTENGHLIALDLENRGLNRSEYDLAKLYFQGNHVKRNVKSFDIIEEEVSRYIEGLNKLSNDGMQITKEKEFLASVLASVPVKAISYYLYASSFKSYTDDVWDFLNNGMFAVDLLQQKFDDLYTFAEIKELRVLQRMSKYILTKHRRLFYV